MQDVHTKFGLPRLCCSRAEEHLMLQQIDVGNLLEFQRMWLPLCPRKAGICGAFADNRCSPRTERNTNALGASPDFLGTAVLWLDGRVVISGSGACRLSGIATPRELYA